MYARLLDPKSDWPEPALTGEHMQQEMRRWVRTGHARSLVLFLQLRTACQLYATDTWQPLCLTRRALQPAASNSKQWSIGSQKKLWYAPQTARALVFGHPTPTVCMRGRWMPSPPTSPSGGTKHKGKGRKGGQQHQTPMSRPGGPSNTRDEVNAVNTEIGTFMNTVSTGMYAFRCVLDMLLLATHRPRAGSP